MSYWAAARLQPRREQLALKLLTLGGFETYFPLIRERRTVRGRGVITTPPLFPGYAFICIKLQWHAARWCPGVLSLVMDGERPAKVPDRDIAALRTHERDGFVVLPKQPKLSSDFHLGDRLRVLSGPFSSLLKNLEIGALAVFLPRVLGRSGCCEQTPTYAVSSLGMRIRL